MTRQAAEALVSGPIAKYFEELRGSLAQTEASIEDNPAGGVQIRLTVTAQHHPPFEGVVGDDYQAEVFLGTVLAAIKRTA